jgi:hypothetical protein
MTNWVNIAKPLANLFGSGQSPLPDLSGGWGRLLLLTTILLLAGSRYAHAQNSSGEPYINSTHLYRVPMGNINNNVKWYISNTNASPQIIELTNSLAWADSGRVDNTDPVLDSAAIEIKFVESVFMDAGSIIADPWILRYEEYDAGGGGCIAVRALDITPTANLFNLTVANLTDDCNSFAGQVWDNTDDLTKDTIMAVTFTVNMAKASNHAVSEYSFTATVSENSTYFSIPDDIDDFILTTDRAGSTDYGSFAIDNINTSTGTFDVRVYNLSGTGYETADEVEFTINLSGPAIYDVDVTLEIEDGQAVSGTNYSVVTDENNTDDNDDTHTLWSIPNTSIVQVAP